MAKGKAQRARRQRPLSHAECAAFFEQLALMLRGGLSTMESLALMQDDAQDARSCALLQQMQRALSAGHVLSAAAAQTGVFPPHALQLLRVGEAAGRLDDVTGSLATYYRRECQLRANIRGAVAYPLVLAGAMVGVVLVLLVYVMPIFAKVFAQLGIEMSPLAAQLTQAGQALGRWALVCLAALAGVTALLLWCGLSRRGRAGLAALAARLPLTRRNSENLAAGRLMADLSILLESGMDMQQSFLLAAQDMAQPRLAAKAKACEARLLQGASLPDALLQAGILTGVDARLLRVGFATGAPAQVLDELAVRKQAQATDSVDRAVSLLEPLLVAVLCALVGLMLLSVMLPLLGILDSLH